VLSQNNDEGAQTYDVRVVATDVISGLKNRDVLFSVLTKPNCRGVEILDPVEDFNLTQVIEYEVALEPAELQIDLAFRDYFSVIRGVEPQCEFEFDMHLLDSHGGMTALPDFITFDPSAETQITVETDKPEDAGTYLFSLSLWLKEDPDRVRYRDFLTVQINCVVKVIEF